MSTQQAMKALVTSVLVIGWLASLTACFGDEERHEKEYVSFETFATWRSLVPEVSGARVCSLTKSGHELWEQGQLRIPASRFLKGDVNGDGREEWVIDLAGPEDEGVCDHLLITDQVNRQWRRVFLQRVKLEGDAQGFAPLLSRPRQAIGIDFGKRRRDTRPATMSWPDGQGQTGFVIEYALISQSVRWNPQSSSFEYRQAAKPEEWDTWVEIEAYARKEQSQSGR